MKKTQNYVTRIQTTLQSTQKQKTYVDIAKDDEKRFDTSDYELKRPLPSRKNKLLN